MALNFHPFEPFGYNGDYQDAFLENGDDIPIKTLFANSMESSTIGVDYDCSNSPVLNFHNTPYESFFDTTKGCNSSTIGAIGEDGKLLFSYPITSTISYVQESLKQERLLQKRRYEGVEVQVARKHCGMLRKTRGKTNSALKDPHDHAAKIRRERISERLKVLQELVPNGTKVDLVTMLEKAISYVKFLQLQVKVLATDEFWPPQEGKALDISQVKEALDAILSLQKENNSSSCKTQN